MNTTLRGFLHRTDPNMITARLSDTLGYIHRLTGVPTVADGVSGYAVSVDVVEVPVDWVLIGDGDTREFEPWP